MKHVTINARREGYEVDQIRHTMTVQELIEKLSEFEPDTPVYLSHDKGYTYGGITQWDFEENYEDEEDENEYEYEE